MKHLALAVIPLFAVLSSVAPAQITFQRTYGDLASDQGWSVTQAAGGGYFVAGFTSSYGAGLSDAWLIRADAFGDTLWTRTFGGESSDAVFSAEQTADSGWVITGQTYSFGAGGGDAWLIRTDASGDTLWTRTFGGADCDWGYSVALTSDSGYVITGSTQSFAAGWSDIWLIRTDPSGDTLWTRTFGGTDYEAGRGVAQTWDGGFVIVGCVSHGSGEGDVWLIKTDASGDTMWTRSFGGEGIDYGYSVAQTDDSGFVVAGFADSYGAGYFDVWLIKTDASGDTMWTRSFGGTSQDYGYSVAQTRDGGYVITGSSLSYGAGFRDAWLVKTDAMGDTMWTRTFGGNRNEECWSVAQTDDGGYVACGQTLSYGSGQEDLWLIKTDSVGRVGIAEPEPPAPVQHLEATILPRAQLLSLLHQDPGLSLFDASGRLLYRSGSSFILQPSSLSPGVFFLHTETATRRVLVVE